MNRESCDGCVHYRPLYSVDKRVKYKHYMCCHYILDTGEPRGCPAENCSKKNTEEEIMKRLTAEDKRKIVRLRIEQSVPASEVAQRFGITKGTVFNIVSDWKKHGDTSITDDIAEDITPDATKKEPARRQPKQALSRKLVKIFPLILYLKKAQIVKSVPYGVREACRVRLDYLKDLIAEEQAVIDNWTAEMKEIIEFLEENKEDVDNG